MSRQTFKTKTQRKEQLAGFVLSGIFNNVFRLAEKRTEAFSLLAVECFRKHIIKRSLLYICAATKSIRQQVKLQTRVTDNIWTIARLYDC